MKTLDEVIEAERYCISDGCRGCPYDIVTYGGSCECNEDALHYLKEYREMKEHLACLDTATLHGEDTQRVNNPALTWDELKSMEGKPVWVEHKHYSKWLIVYEVYENTIVLDGNGCYTQYFSDDNDKEVRWKAYRRER